MAEYKWGAGGGGSGGRDASQIIYDNTQSGLAANNVQAAIDEVVQDLDDAVADITAAQDDIDALEAVVPGIRDDLDDHVADTNNPHAVTKAQVGLSEVDNTSDVNKPISAATQLALDLKIALTQKGAAFGVAPLNSSAKISVDYFPAEMLGNVLFIDVWDASVGTYPTPAFDGNFWIVDVAGIISGTQYYVGDWILYANSAYNRIDNSQLVTSVNGLQGIVVLDTDDISEGSVNKYFTDALARTAAVVNSLAGSETDRAPSVAAVNTALAGKEPAFTTLPISKGGTGQTTKAASFDALAPSSAKGDIVIHSGTGNVRLPVGLDGYVLTADSSASEGVRYTSPTAGFLPPSIVVPYAGSSAPAGWLLCDGSEYSQTTYSDLYAAIGTIYNTQINPTTGLAYSAPASGYFRVPDYRSLFLRGAGTNAAGVTTTLGAYQADATAKNGLTATASTSSISGTAALAGAHTHAVDVRGATGAFSNGATNLEVNGGASVATTYGNSAQRVISNGAHTHPVTGTAAAQTITIGDGDAETRPQNRGVNYIIKV